MKIKQIFIRGWIKLDTDGRILICNEPYEDKARGYAKEDTLYDILADKFMEVGVRSWNGSYHDWSEADTFYIDSVYVRYYVTRHEATWDLVEPERIKNMAGGMIVAKNYGFESGTWENCFVGEHDLIAE